MINKIITTSLLTAFLVSPIGCAKSVTEKDATEATFHMKCSEPRPQICTREYRPVCATRDTGVRCVTTPCPSTELKTYSNGCTACSDPGVVGYQLNACEGTQK